jgi:two-component system phosphate regulon response regulator PhoB
VNGGGPPILVVEDDASLRLLCRINLELDGFRVDEAATVAEARAAVAAARPALVVLDLLLGADTADELLDELRAAAVPVVLLSGAADVETYAGRASAVLGKPFSPEALVDLAKELTVG